MKDAFASWPNGKKIAVAIDNEPDEITYARRFFPA